MTDDDNKYSDDNNSGKKIVICGGGNAAHVFLGLAASFPNNEVHLLSLYEDEAARFQAGIMDKSSQAPGTLTIELVQEKKTVQTSPRNFTNDPAKCLPNADLVIISLPAFAHAQYLSAVAKHVGDHKCLIAMFPGACGLECDWKRLVVDSCKFSSKYSLLSCITLPWACRIKQYGQVVEILGTKSTAAVCVASNADTTKQYCIQAIASLIGELPVLVDDGHLLNMSIGAINAIVHPAIMYAKWYKWDGKPMAEKPLFYQGLDQFGADILTKLSGETIAIAAAITKETGEKLNIDPVFKWYQDTYGKVATDTSSLLSLIRTNPGYNGLTHPMATTHVSMSTSQKYSPDFKHRYLTEDIPYGLCVFKGIAMLLPNPPKIEIIDTVIQWAQSVMNKSYFVYEQNSNNVTAVGADIQETRAPQKYGFKSIKEII